MESKLKLGLVLLVVGLFVATLGINYERPSEESIVSDISYPYPNQIGWSNPVDSDGNQIFDSVTGKPLEKSN